MKTKKHISKIKRAAKKYLDAQLRILNRYGSARNLTSKEYKSILRDVERATLVSQ
jgi:hypothetical protein